MRSSSKRGVDSGRTTTPRFRTVHERLNHALNLGFGSSQGESKRKWQSKDIEVQRLAVRSIEAFLDCLSAEKSHHLLVKISNDIKDSVADIVRALVGILQIRNEAILSVAANVTVKLVSILHNLIQQFYVLDLVHPLSSALLSQQEQVTLSCASSLNLLLSNVSLRKEREVLEVLEETDTIGQILICMEQFSPDMSRVETFHEIATLLSTIVSRWQSFRYRVWNNAKVMSLLKAIREKQGVSVRVAVLKIYSSIVLCGQVANRLLEDDAELLQIVVQSMGSSYPHSIRLEAFKLAQCLATNEHASLKIIGACCEPIVSSIICGMSGWSLQSRRVAGDEMPLLLAACQLALITRWAGKHHMHFWKLGIDRVLLHFVVDGSRVKLPSQHSLSLEEQISVAQEGLNCGFLLSLRPYVWNILGYIATHCEENFDPSVQGNEFCIGILISCACLVFVDSIRKIHQLHQDSNVALEVESASKAVVMMIYSPSQRIAAKAAIILSKILSKDGEGNIKYLVYILKSVTMRGSIGYPDTLQIAISLMGLVCYSGLSQYHRCIMEFECLKTLSAFTRWCLSGSVDIRRRSAASHLLNSLQEKTCCWVYLEDWEGDNILLTFSLWGLAALMHHSDSLRNNPDIAAVNLESNGTFLIDKFKEICCSETYASGPRWYASYILSCNGSFVIPTKLGKRMREALSEKEISDMQLNLGNGESLSVHRIVLAVRCPMLLPPEEMALDDKTAECSSVTKDVKKQNEMSKREVRLSACVDPEALMKLLEFVYTGYLQTEEYLVQKLKILAKHCKLQLLLQMLNRKIPKWGTPLPCFDLTLALGPVGKKFSDVILEAEAAKLMSCTCYMCSMVEPHMHVHKIVLWSSCDYLRALLQSGMQESHAETIKVPVSWEALVKLVDWLYSNRLPSPPSGCLWNNMSTEEKCNVLEPYLELCWLAEFWFLEELEESCTALIISSLESAKHVSVRIMQTAADLSLWKLAEAAAEYVAPLYSQLRDSGDLEGLDDVLVDLVRTVSVRLSHEGGRNQR